MAATSAGTQNPNQHRCGIVGQWDIRCSVGKLRLWLGAPFCRGGGPACYGVVGHPCAGYPACLTLLHHRRPILQIIRKIFCSRNYFPFFHISLCCSPFILSFTFTSKFVLRKDERRTAQ